MPAWQVVLEFLKTIGIGTLAGVLVGAGTARWQKSKEALQAIKGANYREVVAEYRKLAVQLQSMVDTSRTALSTVTTILRLFGEEPDQAGNDALDMLKLRLRDDVTAYDEAFKGLDERLANLLVHRSETNFHSYSRHVDMVAGMMSVELSVLSIRLTEEQYREGVRAHGKLEEAVGVLRAIWDVWKIEAEREAAGLRPQPLFRPSRIFLSRRL